MLMKVERLSQGSDLKSLFLLWYLFSQFKGYKKELGLERSFSFRSGFVCLSLNWLQRTSKKSIDFTALLNVELLACHTYA